MDVYVPISNLSKDLQTFHIYNEVNVILFHKSNKQTYSLVVFYKILKVKLLKQLYISIDTRQIGPLHSSLFSE